MKNIIKKWLGITDLEKELVDVNNQIKELKRTDDLERKFQTGIANIENLKSYFNIG